MSAADPRHLARLLGVIGGQLEDHLRPILPGPLGRWKLTFLATVDGEPELDILVTETDESTIRSAVERRFLGPEVAR